MGAVSVAVGAPGAIDHDRYARYARASHIPAYRRQRLLAYANAIRLWLTDQVGRHGRDWDVASDESSTRLYFASETSRDHFEATFGDLLSDVPATAPCGTDDPWSALDPAFAITAIDSYPFEDNSIFH